MDDPGTRGEKINPHKVQAGGSRAILEGDVNGLLDSGGVSVASDAKNPGLCEEPWLPGDHSQQKVLSGLKYSQKLDQKNRLGFKLVP